MRTGFAAIDWDAPECVASQSETATRPTGASKPAAAAASILTGQQWDGYADLPHRRQAFRIQRHAHPRQWTGATRQRGDLQPDLTVPAEADSQMPDALWSVVTGKSRIDSCHVREASPGTKTAAALMSATCPRKSSPPCQCRHLLHRNQPAAAPCLCFGRAHAVPAGRAVGCNIAGKLSGNRRDSMRAAHARAPGGVVPMVRWGPSIRRATSLKAGLSPLGNSRLPASRAPAPRDWADPSRRTINDEHRCTGCTG